MPCERQRLDTAFDRVAIARPSALTPENQKLIPIQGRSVSVRITPVCQNHPHFPSETLNPTEAAV
jgi:hypothetical protein